MRILSVSGDAFYPQASGGVQVCLNELTLALREAAHSPSLFVALWGGRGELRSRIGMRLTGKPWVHHRWSKFDVFRAWHPWEQAQAICSLVRPDAVIVQGTKHAYKIAKAFLDTGVPVALYFHDVYFDILGGDLRELDKLTFISNSEFTRDRVLEVLGVNSSVVPPIFFDAAAYEVKTVPANVTFINPLPLKGSGIAFKAAELCPHIPFHFVQSWSLTRGQEKSLRKQVKRLPNVRFSRPVYDMRGVYRQAKIMLVPSQVDEAWGRVVSEAQCSGIPAVYSRAGGLPEAAGDAGICLDRTAPASDWADAIKELWSNANTYASLSAAARNMARKYSAGKAERLAGLIGFAAAA